MAETTKRRTKRLSTEEQTQILIREARGDSRRQIGRDMGISGVGVGKVVQRNQELLAHIKMELLQHHMSKAQLIHEKAARLIDQTLQKALDRDAKYAEYLADLEAGEIDIQEFRARVDALPQLQMKDVIAAYREANSQIAQVTPKGSPAASKELTDGKEDKATATQIEDLIQKINDGDTVALERIVLNPDNGEDTNGAV